MKEIEELNKLTDEQLYEKFGKAVFDNDFQGFGDYKAKALDWLEARQGRIYKAICREDRYPALKKEFTGNELIEAFIVSADVWLAEEFSNIPYLTLAKLLIIQGLDNYCGCE